MGIETSTGDRASLFDRVHPWAPSVLAAVAIGGALGGSARWAVGWSLGQVGAEVSAGVWPWPTLVVNVVGSIAIGIAAGRLHRDTLAWAFLVTGVLGGFTTYSSFAVEIDRLAAADRVGVAAAYMVTTLAAGLGAVAVAVTLSERPRSNRSGAPR